MAGKLLKETKDIENKKKKNNKKVEEDNIYKIDLDIPQNDQQSIMQEELKDSEQLEKIPKAKTKAKNDNTIIKIDDDDEIDEIFGNVNKWLKDAENEVIEKRPRRRLAKIEEGIRSSKITKEETTKKSTNNKTKEKKEEVITESEDIVEPTKIEEKEAKKTKKLAAKETEKKAKTRSTSKISEDSESEKSSRVTKTVKKHSGAKKSTNSKAKVDDIYNLNNLEDLDDENNENDINYKNNIDQEDTTYYQEDEDIEIISGKPSEIKIHAENNLTEILLKKNRYKIEIQKTEYNIYTDANETSYLIVRDPMLRIVSGGVYILLEKQGEDYEITTNQDFKINYVIDNLERKNNTVNFKLTNLTEILANDEGLIFEIDEEKVIENNLEDNNTLVISEEDGKVYLPYTKEDIKNDVMQSRGSKISEVIQDKYILPIDKYKNSMRARFREGYNLMYRKEGKSKRSAIMLGIELMFETNLHPAIISACKNLEELDIYLDCLEDNELEKFSCFKIIYKSLPTLRKKAKFQEF